jgi:hypothetical protein
MQITDPYSGEECFTNTQFWVEADSFSRHELWAKFHKDYVWKQILTGLNITVGHVNDRSVVISVSWFYIDNVRVGFYHGCSQLVDHLMIEEWFKKYDVKYDRDHRRAFTDAGNFHHCLHALDELRTLRANSLVKNDCLQCYYWTKDSNHLGCRCYRLQQCPAIERDSR